MPISDRPPAHKNLSRSPVWREIMAFYRYLKPGLWAMRLPWIGPLFARWFIKDDSEANWIIPVEAAIPSGERYILPGMLVERLLESADGVFAMAACPCRTAFQCRDHPQDIGCLHIGPATRDIPTEVGRPLTRQGGVAHLEHALDAGLMPTILYIPSEADIFRVDRKRMLSLCFCCECCCDVRLLLRQGPDRYWDLYNHRLPGVTVEVGDNCTLCGACVEVCYGGERVITLGPGRAQIDERCLGCGLCVSACPEGAIKLNVDPRVDVQESLLAQVKGWTSLD